MTIGERINKERKRLGYSQPAFAAIAGASKGSQIAWEKGTAYPNAAALADWGEIGVDVTYILTGEISKDEALWSVLNSIQGILELSRYDTDLRFCCLLAYEELEAFKTNKAAENKSYPAILALLEKSPALLLDQVLFENMLEKLEFVLDAKKLSLTSTAKSKAIMYLYKSVQAAGKRVDLGMVESAIKLALS